MIGDKLFSKSLSASGAILHQFSNERLYHMTIGYKLAADTLIEHTYTEAWKTQKLVYPIIFCYRHFLELTLKSMLEEYSSASVVTSNWSHHKLEDLWKAFRGILKEVGAEDPKEHSIDAVEQCIAEFSKIDPVSETFRYPTNRRGSPLHISLEIIDLIQLRSTMEAIDNFFSVSRSLLDDFKSAKSYYE